MEGTKYSMSNYFFLMGSWGCGLVQNFTTDLWTGWVWRFGRLTKHHQPLVSYGPLVATFFRGPHVARSTDDHGWVAADERHAKTARLERVHPPPKPDVGWSPPGSLTSKRFDFFAIGSRTVDEKHRKITIPVAPVASVSIFVIPWFFFCHEEN